MASTEQFRRSNEPDHLFKPKPVSDQEIEAAMELDSPEILVGGHLKFFASRWRRITSDPQVLDIVTYAH